MSSPRQDADGDPVIFRLDAAPAGAAINPTTSIVQWTPGAAQLGSQHFVIVASDGRGGEATQTFDLTVLATALNDPPQILSTPRETVQLGRDYRYLFEAVDPNGDPLTFRLDVAPQGMTIDTAGLVLWHPAADRVGANLVRLVVEDGRGGSASDEFSILVTTDAANRVPVIISNPVSSAAIGQPYAYNARATDADGDPLLWSLDAGPAGMSIDPASGAIRWMPRADQRGLQSVAISVADGQGGTARQTFQIAVSSVNRPPAILSVPPTEAFSDDPYRYAVRATDPDGDALAFALTVAPAGMTIDAGSGLIRWTPSAAQVGVHSIEVHASDPSGAIAIAAIRHGGI